MAALPELKYIGVMATGYNVVDIEAARERGIVVTNIACIQHTVCRANGVCTHSQYCATRATLLG